jgi:hypothetical protein
MSDVIVGDGQTLAIKASTAKEIVVHLKIEPPGPPQIDDAVDITAFSQCDERWADEVYAGGATFASTGCLVCDVAMIASLRDSEPDPPPIVAQKMRDAGCFQGAFLSHPSRIPAALPGLEWGGVVHWRRRSADLEILKREIAIYGATICEVLWDIDLPLTWTNTAGVTKWNQHFVVVTRTDLLNDDAVIIDPWDGKKKLLSLTKYAHKKGWGARRALYGMRLVRVSNAT